MDRRKSIKALIIGTAATGVMLDACKTDNKKTERIHEIVKGNLQLKQLLTGITIALFTEEEMTFYHENKKEVVKRTITILLERVCSQLQNLNF